MTTWYKNFEDDGQWRYPRYPARVPKGGVKKYFWNWKCLEAPKPYFDNDGYYYWREYFIRKVVPGLISLPEPMQTMTTEDVTLLIKDSLKKYR